jgi:hypothetical protein
MRSHDFAMLFKDARRELDENRELFCSLSEILIIFMPILPSALWNRTLVLLLYILLYNVNAQDKYYELKERFLAAPIMHYANADAREAESSDDEADASEAEADASDEEADASDEEADASDEEADASDEEADASDEDDPNDSDYEEKKKETKKNK